ncbi:MAG: RHS repeat-associated core domain-containing protein [Firmicutes bacterium]|nr:RHS repeat-associated core domain-containing protein [Bacillota bacterium]
MGPSGFPPTVEFSWDSNGNLIQKIDHSQGNAVTSYAYDFENHLTQVTFPDTTTESYKYSGDGLRVSKRRDTGPSGIEISYILSGSDVIRETSAVWGNPPPPATPTTDYILAGSMAGPLGLKQPGNPTPIYHYTHGDGQGSVMGLTDDSGAITDQYQYDAWGSMAFLPNPPPNQTYNPYHYTGQQVDQSTGLYYLRNRYYDAQAGRFTTEDPIGFDGGLNLFTYCDNDPVNSIDPEGQQGAGTIAIEAGGTAGGAIGGPVGAVIGAGIVFIAVEIYRYYKSNQGPTETYPANPGEARPNPQPGPPQPGYTQPVSPGPQTQVGNPPVIPGPTIVVPMPPIPMAKGGKQKISDTELNWLPKAEIDRLAKGGPGIPKDLQRRAQKQQKFYKRRNIQKRCK